MRVAVTIVLLCAAVDLIGCAVLLLVVWVEHRRVRREAAESGEVVPSAAGQFGCLGLCLLAGLVGLGLSIRFLVQE